jgi:hypothetical protein
MIRHAISASNCHSERSEGSAFSFGVYNCGSSSSPRVISSTARPLRRRALSPSVIPNVAGRFFSSRLAPARRSASECEESLLWFVRWLFCRSSGLRGKRVALCRSRLPNGQILAHFFEALRAKPANRQQIVHALKRPVRFAHLQNLFRRRRPDPRSLLQFFRRRGVDVYRLRRCTDQAEEKKEEREPK